MSSRLFHYSEGESHKFWSVTVHGESFTVRFGRIGTDGQTQAKTFASAAEATQAAEKLIAEKARKGYREVSADEARTATKKPVPRRGAKPAYQQMLLPF